MELTGRRRVSKQALGVLLILSILLALLAPWMPVDVYADDPPVMTFKNITEDGGADVISMTERRTFEVVVPLEAGQNAQQIIDRGNLVWKLKRTEGMQDKNDFPNQYLGGTLESWTKYNSTTSLFTLDTPEAVTVGGQPAIRLTFSNELFFATRTSVNSNRNNILDYTGEYTLSCSYFGVTYGTCTVRFNPYDSFRTNAEYDAELIEAATAANAREGMYAYLGSMGTSSEGRDMPYLIIADSEQTVKDYRTLKELAEQNPAALQAQVDNGTLDYKVPVLYSNVHSDETNGGSAVMDFIWDLALSEPNTPSSYNMLTGMKVEGKTRLDAQRANRGQHTSALIEPFGPTFLGAITPSDTNNTSGVVNLEQYYEISSKELDVDALLEDVFFILIPSENVDGKTYNVRNNAEGFDLNRDNLFQTQVETQNITKFIAEWNPIAFIELHGFVGGFQIEPCTPPHEPNVEYDLYGEMAFKGGEAFGAAAVANNTMYNSYVMPLRDYLVTSNEQPYWSSPWDDMSTNYTPQYSLLHGTVAYTIEVPADNQQGVVALEYGFFAFSNFVKENKDTLFMNQLEGYRRGIENIDAESVRPWYVDANDNVGAEAGIFRPRDAENNNFFPEYYVIPMDLDNQKNLAAANEMEAFLIRNGVTVSRLTEDVSVNDAVYQAGSIVVDMHQAKRNVANGALYEGVLITEWPTLYSEPITAFDKTRGFDCTAIHTAGAFEGKLTVVASADGGQTQYKGREGNAVVIRHSGIEAVRAVNQMLSDGQEVGYITEGPYTGDFLVAYDTFSAYKDDFVLNAYGLQAAPSARKIEQPTIYIAGNLGEATTGYVDYNRIYNSNQDYNFNRFAIVEQMQFNVTDNIARADIILANGALTTARSDANAVKAAVEGGTPFISAASNAFLRSLLGNSNLNYTSHGSTTDALTTVEYIEKSYVTEWNYLNGDDIVYGHGGNVFTIIPDGAKVLIKTTTEDPMEGFIRQDRLEVFKDGVIAFEYFEDGMDITAFVNTLTRKAHQQDEYRFITNAVYSKVAVEDFVIQVENGDIEFPTIDSVTFDPEAKLANVMLPNNLGNGKFKWVDDTEVPIVKKSNYAVMFVPNDAGEVDYSDLDGWSAELGAVVRNVAVTVLPKELTTENTTVQIESQTYTGSPIEPAVTVVYNGRTLTKDDYTVKYSNNTDVGSKAVASVVLKGNYTGDILANFTITKALADIVDFPEAMQTTYAPEQTLADLGAFTGGSTNGTFTWADATVVLTVSVSEYAVSFKPADVDLADYSEFDGWDADTQTLIGKVRVDVAPKALSKADVEMTVADQQYTGSALKPEVSLTYNGHALTSEDFSVDYDKNVDVGNASLSIAFKGNYSGSFASSFSILPAVVTKEEAEITIDDQKYTGKAVEPDVTVVFGGLTLEEGKDFTVKFTDNVKIGEAKAEFTFKGNYAGAFAVTFNITSEGAQQVDKNRLSGDNRFETAVAISQASFKTAQSVVLVDGYNFPDALAAGPLAYALKAPVLMVDTHTQTLDEGTKNEIKRLGATEIYILGGSAVISDKLELSLVGEGYSVARIAGDNRYGTAALIAETLAELKGIETHETVILAFGGNYPDALGVGPGASLNGYPIVFTAADTIPPESQKILANAEHIIIVGGTSVVGETVEELLVAETIERLSGDNRYETGIEIQQYFFEAAETAFAATGNNFADALTGGVVAARAEAPIILVDGKGSTVPDFVTAYIKSSGATRIVIYGGSSAVSGTVQRLLNAAL